MKKCDCGPCKFENPKLTSTAVIIKDQKLLVAKRNEEPFKGEWDFIGGYLNKNESPEEGMKREIKEELNTDCKTTYIGNFTGTALYKNYEYPILTFVYLVELEGEIKISANEIKEVSWIELDKLDKVAFDSGMDILKFVKEKFSYNLEDVKALISQLDPSAKFNEQSLYKAMYDGYVSKIEENDKLLGMGWIFPRQTILRNQAVVEDMIVDQGQRGKGLGEKILLDLIEWAKNNGVEVVELTTNPKRVAANSLYQKVGFKLHPTNHYLLDLK